MTTGERNAGPASTDDEQDDGLPASSRHSGFGIGPLVGLVGAAVALLGYAWLNRTPDLPLSGDFSSINSVLWRTTFVVGGSALLVVLYLTVGRAYVRSVSGRAIFLASTAPALAVLAVAGVMALGRGGAKAAFTAAADAQLALHPLAVTTLARSAWWFSCLAVGWLALVCLVGYFAGPSDEPRRWIHGGVFTAGVAGVVAVGLAVAVVVPAHQSPFQNQTADRIDAPTLSALRGEVAYRAEVKPIATYVRPGGAGFVHLTDGGSYDADRVEGFDGATGQKRWSFALPRFNVSSMRTTGIGPDSVVLVKAYIPTDSLIALDATTGRVLWVRSDDKSFDDDYPLSPAVMLMGPEAYDDAGKPDLQHRQWRALSPRTGEPLWTKTFDLECYVDVHGLETALLMRTCDDGPDVVARVLDPQTGEQRSVITATSLGADTALLDPRRPIRVESTAGDRVMVSGAGAYAVFDLPSGKVIANIPRGTGASFIDADSMMLWGPVPDPDAPSPVSVLDLTDGATIPTGLFRSWSGNEVAWAPFARVGDQWLTFLPDAQALPQVTDRPGQERSTFPLRIVNRTGVVKTVDGICEHFEGIPLVSAVPGAVLAVCKVDAVAAIR